MKKGWLRFIGSLEMLSRFMHRNKFLSEFGNFQLAYPEGPLHHGTKRSPSSVPMNSTGAGAWWLAG